MVSLLKHLLEVQFRTFLNQVDDELRARLPVDFNDLNDRMEAEERQVRQSVRLLLHKYPQIRKDADVIGALETSLKEIDRLLRDAQELADSFEKGRAQLVNLAGLGLMVEILAHELNRATQHALSTLADTDLGGLARDVGDRLNTLRAQLTTLQKRLRILDPLSQPGRQVKEAFDLIAWVGEILSSHEPQFRRHGIKCSVEVEPSRPASGLVVRMVKGMIVQILENLLSNSVYWLKQQRKLDRRFSPRIDIVIDTKAREIRLTDNGPGIPAERAEEVFQAFVTTKPPGEGKGLGLYISREIARYHGAALILSEKPRVHKNRLNTFVLMLSVSGK
jgi:signal transduction histidine kinase